MTNAVSARIDVHRLAAVLFEQIALAVQDFQHAERRHPDALIGEHGVGARDFEQRRVAGAERDREIGREVLLESEALRIRQHVVGPSESIVLIGRDIARVFERPSQRDRAFELVVVVLRRVRLAVVRRITDGLIDDGG